MVHVVRGGTGSRRASHMYTQECLCSTMLASVDTGCYEEILVFP